MERPENCAGLDAVELPGIWWARGAPRRAPRCLPAAATPPRAMLHSVHPHLLLLARDEAAVRRGWKAPLTMTPSSAARLDLLRLLGELFSSAACSAPLLRALEASLRHHERRRAGDRGSSRRASRGRRYQQLALAAAHMQGVIAQPPLHTPRFPSAAAAARRPFSKVEERRSHLLGLRRAARARFARRRRRPRRRRRAVAAGRPLLGVDRPPSASARRRRPRRQAARPPWSRGAMRFANDAVVDDGDGDFGLWRNSSNCATRAARIRLHPRLDVGIGRRATSSTSLPPATGDAGGRGRDELVAADAPPPLGRFAALWRFSAAARSAAPRSPATAARSASGSRPLLSPPDVVDAELPMQRSTA